MDLYQVAQNLLDAVGQHMEEQGIILPEIQYVAPGNEVAYDCELLTVHLVRILSNYQGTDTTFPSPYALLVNSAEFNVTMARCVPVLDEQGNLPPMSELSDSAGGLMRDARAMRRAMEQVVQFCDVAPRNVPQTVGAVQTVGPQGGMAGIFGMYTVQLIDDEWHRSGESRDPTINRPFT